MERILVAGATGYLGKYLLLELKKRGYYTLALARNAKKLNGVLADEVIQAEATRPHTLENACRNVDGVISTIGITKQKDGLTYMDVDYQANSNLLKEALRSGVKLFTYVSVLNGPHLKDLKMIAAKERFVDELKSSGMDYIILRPNGFFSDMTEVLHMSRKGRVYLFGNGKYASNPIHGADLAEFMVKNLHRRNIELEVGGPDLLSQEQIAQMAFSALEKKGKIVHIPLWIRDIVLNLLHLFTGQKTYGPVEFFLTVMTMDMIAPAYGHYGLQEYYQDIVYESS